MFKKPMWVQTSQFPTVFLSYKNRAVNREGTCSGAFFFSSITAQTLKVDMKTNMQLTIKHLCEHKGIPSKTKKERRKTLTLPLYPLWVISGVTQFILDLCVHKAVYFDTRVKWMKSRWCNLISWGISTNKTWSLDTSSFSTLSIINRKGLTWIKLFRSVSKQGFSREKFKTFPGPNAYFFSYTLVAAETISVLVC